MRALLSPIIESRSTGIHMIIICIKYISYIHVCTYNSLTRRFYTSKHGSVRLDCLG